MIDIAPTANETVKQQIELWECTPTTSYIELPQGEYIIDGEKISIKGYNQKHIVDTPKSLSRITQNTVHDHYVDKEGEKLSVENYRLKVNSLEKEGYYDEDEYCVCFNDIDAQYNYSKFKQNWSLVSHQEEVITEMELVVHVDLGQPNKFITPMKKLNGNLKDTMYQYNKAYHTWEKVKEVLLKYGKTPDGHESKLKFSKVEGQYLTIMIKSLDKYKKCFTMTDTLEKCLLEFNKVEADIARAIDVHYQSDIDAAKCLKMSILLQELNSVLQQVRKIDPKQKSYHAKRESVNTLEKLIVKVEDKVVGKAIKHL